MTALKATKRALFSSVLALILCFAMLLGTTFAWFTDSAVSANNKVQAGTLDVDLIQWTSATESAEITDSSAPLFPATTIWEPGRTEVVYLSIKNNGSLDLKYKVAIQTKEVTDHDLREVMSYAITPDAQYGEVTSWLGQGETAERLDLDSANTVATEDVTLKKGQEHFFALSIHMDEEAGNVYMGDSIVFDINVLAGQLASEEDGYGNPNYDAFAEYPGTSYAPIVVGTATTVTITSTTGYNVGSLVAPSETKYADDAEQLKVTMEESQYKPDITIDTGDTKHTVDITVVGLADDNTAPVKVTYKLAAGMDPATVKVYHYDTLIDSTYNPNTGYVTFESTNFSPFTFVYDADSEYVAPEVKPEMTPPTATVVYASEHVGEGKITWGEFGQWSPTAGLEANLEAAFVFTCPEDLDPAVEAAFEYWYCDFYVSLNKDLGANQLFLGGNYGSFGWVGFHNGDLELEANTEIGLLESVTTNPWTYADVRDFVGEFTCGVGDVNNALDGATFTVKLRLTNPANENEIYDVNVVTHTFGGNSVIDDVTVVTSGQGLQDAVNDGETNIVLGDDIDLSQGIVIPAN